MATHSEVVTLPVGEQRISATFMAPATRWPGVLFVHGWGASQKSDELRAASIAGLGCICLTFDLRGHEETAAQRASVTPEDNLRDIVAAYDLLASHPGLDTDAIAVVGSSYGGYLSAILTTLRPVKWLALHVPALYRDEDWRVPKYQLNREDLTRFRQQRLRPDENRALAACLAFEGDVLIVESEHDAYVPHTTIMNYRAAFQHSHSLTHRIIDDADHALSTDRSQVAYTSILVNWVSEMVIGARVASAAHWRT